MNPKHISNSLNPNLFLPRLIKLSTHIHTFTKTLCVVSDWHTSLTPSDANGHITPPSVCGQGCQIGHREIWAQSGNPVCECSSTTAGKTPASEECLTQGRGQREGREGWVGQLYQGAISTVLPGEWRLVRVDIYLFMVLYCVVYL